MNLTEFLKKRLCCLFAANPKRGITYAWLASLVLVFVAFIVACVSGSKLSSGQQNNSQSFARVAAFAAIWTSILLIVISILGTVIMRRFQTPLAIGYFLGVIFIMTQQMLIIFAIFVDHARAVKNQTLQAVQAQNAMASFSFFLFVVYAIFGTMLAVFRNDIIKEVVIGEDPDATQLPPEPQEQPPEYK